MSLCFNMYINVHRFVFHDAEHGRKKQKCLYLSRFHFISFLCLKLAKIPSKRDSNNSTSDRAAMAFAVFLENIFPMLLFGGVLCSVRNSSSCKIVSDPSFLVFYFLLLLFSFKHKRNDFHL